MRHLVWVLFGALPAVAVAQVPIGPSLTGTTSTVNAGAGDQTDPHVSCDSVAYTSEVSGASEIRFHNLRTSSDQPIPSGGAFDSLSDVNGGRVVFTRTIPGQSSIFFFDTNTPTTAPRELAPVAGSVRLAAAIGGNTVVWQDFGYSASGLDSEIVVYDLVARTTQRLTNDLLLDRSPAVSADGNVIVFAKCETSGTNCDVYKTVKTGTTWSTPVAVTGAGGDDTLPDTNGTVVVYGSVRGADQDIYFQPVAGGTEQRLLIPGEDANANISGSLIAFEHLEPGSVNRDLLLYDISTQTGYRLTQTANLDETLNDISVCADGLVRVVYTVREGSGAAANQNVYAFSFRIAKPPPACSNGGCADPGTRPLLASFELKREKGSPTRIEKSFKAEPGPGLVCIDNNKACGRATLNCGGDDEKGHSGKISFSSSATTIERKVQLKKQNKISATIDGKPGSSFKLRVFGTDLSCSASGTMKPLAAPDYGVGSPGPLETIEGLSASVSDDGVLDLSDLFPRSEMPASMVTEPSNDGLPAVDEQPATETEPTQSCASGGTQRLAWPLLALLGMWAAWRRRHTRVEQRVSRTRSNER